MTARIREIIDLSIVKAAACAVGMCMWLQTLASERCLDVSTSPQHEVPVARKLTLSIGQSTASVSSDPALTDIVAADPFDKGVAVYVNQPFNLTYQQEGLTFNVPKTHTLWMSPRDKKLAILEIEPCPLFENDFEAAVRALNEWRVLFNGMNLKEIEHHPRFKTSDIASLGERFKSAPELPRFGQNVGVWRVGNTYLRLALVRVERDYVERSRNAVARKAFVYKISVTLLDAEKFDAQ